MIVGPLLKGVTMFESNEERADRKQLLAIIRELRDELQTERAYSQQLREKSIRDIRDLRAMREVMHELRQRLHAQDVRTQAVRTQAVRTHDQRGAS